MDGEGESVGNDSTGRSYTFWRQSPALEVPLDLAIKVETEKPQRFEIVDRTIVDKLLVKLPYKSPEKDELEKESKKPDKESSKLYKTKLEDIKGIGRKTAKDIIRIYPTEEKLLKALENGSEVPIRDDLANLLKNNFKK